MRQTNIDEYSKESLEEYKKRPRKDIFYETYRLYEELYHNSYSKLTRSVKEIIEEYQ